LRGCRECTTGLSLTLSLSPRERGQHASDGPTFEGHGFQEQVWLESGEPKRGTGIRHEFHELTRIGLAELAPPEAGGLEGCDTADWEICAAFLRSTISLRHDAYFNTGFCGLRSMTAWKVTGAATSGLERTGADIFCWNSA